MCALVLIISIPLGYGVISLISSVSLSPCKTLHVAALAVRDEFRTTLLGSSRLLSSINNIYRTPVVSFLSSSPSEPLSPPPSIKTLARVKMAFSLSGIRILASIQTVGPSSRSSINGDRKNTNLSLLKKDPLSWKIFAGKSSYDADSASTTVAASEKVLVPGGESDGFSSSTDTVESLKAASEDSQVLEEVVGLPVEDDGKIEDEQESFTSQLAVDDALDSVPAKTMEGDGEAEVKQRSIPPPGTGRKIYEIDPLLRGFKGHLDYRYNQYRNMREQIDKFEGGLDAFSRGYEKFGFIRSETGITYREWAPGAKFASLIGDFNNWNPNADIMTRNEFGVWEIFLPNNADGSPPIPHGSRVKIHMDTPSGFKDSIPAWIKFSVQAPGEIPYNGIYYDPPEEEKYVFEHPQPKRPKSLRIYESHVGMSSPEPKINTYVAFRDDVLPRIKKLGYNAVQIMAIQEHSYYGSFGYHVTNFFASSSRFGTPDELKSLIDKAHELGILVLMDIVHSHASSNVLDGLNMFDGTDGHYFHSGSRGHHWLWDSRLFNYGSWEVLRYLLSNARWWLDEYKFDGFRFDGVTSMMYTHHGLQVGFTGNYNEYFGLATDVDAVVYLMLVNDLIHGLFPEAVTVGEDVSGMPTFCIPVQDGGVGFDYRLHMAVADKWIEILKQKDEDWKMGDIVSTLTNRRWGEKCVAYAESHDQALVGDKTIAFWLMDKDMYEFMAVDIPSTPRIDRGISLHKMIRLVTMGLGGEGYLNFMGNEFGHPEWVDFPRGEQRLPNGTVIPGNNNSYDKCRRRFDLGDANYLRYRGMQEFDQAMQHLEEAYGLIQEIVRFQQNSRSLKDYYSMLRGMWDELDMYQPLPSKCKEDHEHAHKQRDDTRIMQFLAGLNYDYLHVRDQFMTSKHTYISRKDEGDKMIIFERGDLVFVFNFHWYNSFTDYRVGCLKPGKYKVVLDSDDKLFGGFGRLDPSAEYFSTEGWYDNRPRSLLIYAPCRTAVIYAPVD